MCMLVLARSSEFTRNSYPSYTFLGVQNERPNALEALNSAKCSNQLASCVTYWNSVGDKVVSVQVQARVLCAGPTDGMCCGRSLDGGAVLVT